MKFSLKSSLVFLLFPVLLSCQTVRETETETPASPTAQSTQTTTDSPKNQTFPLVDVPKLANKSPEEIDKVLGKPDEVRKITEQMPGEYRLYKSVNYPKGLAVRFYQNKAIRFNLILSEAFPTSKEALLKSFGIDVGKLAPTKEKNEPLTEIFKGTFGGVKFSKVSAKRQENGDGFIFVLADVE